MSADILICNLQCVLEFRKEACSRELVHCLNVRQFRLDVVEDMQNLGIGRAEGDSDIGRGANGEAKDCHAVDCLRPRCEDVNAG